MIKTFGFGQPNNGIIQMAYIVPDVKAAMLDWTKRLGVGPWYFAENFTGMDPVYRGQPSKALIHGAVGFAGHMQIELIEPADNHPSVYKEMIDTIGYGFHHFGKGVSDVEAEVAKLTADGYEIAFTDKAPPKGNRIVYLKATNDMPGFIELIEADDGVNQAFTMMYEASIGWDGSDPIRSFAPPE